MVTFPTSPLTEIASIGDSTFPLLTSITVADLVGPEAANRQPVEIDTRTQTLRDTVNQCVVQLNAIGTGGPSSDNLFLPRDGSSAMGADLPMGANKITGLGVATDPTDGMSQAASDARLLKRDGSNAMTGALDFGSQKGVNIADATDPQDVPSYLQLTNAFATAVLDAYPLTFNNVDINFAYDSVNVSTITLAAEAEIACRNWSVGQPVAGTPLMKIMRNSGAVSGTFTNGALNPDSWYYLFLLGNTTNPSYAQLHWQLTPDMTSGQLSAEGADVYRRIGAFKTVPIAGYVVEGNQIGKRFMYEASQLLMSTSPATGGGASAANYSLSALVSPKSRTAVLEAYGRGRRGNLQYLYAGYPGTQGYVFGYAHSYETSGGSDIYGDFANMGDIPLDSSRQIGLGVNSSWNIINISIAGFVDDAI